MHETFSPALSYLDRSNSMSRFAERTFFRFVLLAASFLVIPAFAQFEIAPDHFDGSEQQTATHKSNVKAKAKPA